MAEKKRKSKKVALDKARIIRVNIIGNVFSYEHTTVKEKENNNADFTD